MQNRPEIFYVEWINKTWDVIGEEYIVAETLEKARGKIGQRLYQSPHIIPDGVYGFHLRPDKPSQDS